MESPTAASPSLPPNKSIFPEQDVSRVALRRHSVDKASRSGSISLKPTENRELANENNILHKENERKEHRIQALTKEIQSLRVTHSNDQRELKLMANTIDLLKKEKGQLEQERRHSLSKQQQLQHLLDQHQQSKTLLEANERLLKEIDGLKLTISSQQGELLLRKEEIGRLTEELQVAALTIQTQNNYDNAIFYDQLAPTSTSLPVKTNLSLSFGKNREVLKQLYFDLSKKTVNNQSLSEELAATARSHHLLRDTHSQTLAQLQQVREERNRLLVERDEVLRRCEESDRERQSLSQRLKDESDAVQQREKQLSELTRRLTEYRVTSEQQRHELGYELTEARKEVQRAEDTSQRLRQTIETMTAEEQRLQQLLVETRQLYEEEKKHLLEQQRHLSDEVRALHEVRKRCEEVQVALEQKEVICQQLQKRCEEVEQEKYEVKGKVSYVSYHLQKERDTSAQLQSQYDHLLAAHRKQEQEKEEVMQAFQQLLRTSKELVTQHEEAKREIAALQQRVEEVQAVRENMNSAILNALFDERMKSMISKQMDADAVLKQQLQAQQLPPPHTLPHTLPRQSQQVLLGYATLRTPSEQMEEVEARIARGDFDWLNDDHVIHSVLNESLTQARAMGGVAPAITKETDTSEHERNPILIELEKFQQEISQLHATPTNPPLNTTINNSNKDKNTSYTSHTSSHSSGSRSQQQPPPPPQLPHTTTPVNISHMTSHTPPQPSQHPQLSSYSLSYSPYNNTTLLSPPINTTTISTNNSNPNTSPSTNTTTPQLPPQLLPQPLPQFGELPMTNTPINNNNDYKTTTPHSNNNSYNSSQPRGGGGGVISNLLDITLASDVTNSRVMEGSGLAMTLTQSKGHSSHSNSTSSHANSNNSRSSNSNSRSNSDVSLVIDQLSEVLATKTSTTNTPYTTLPQPLPQPPLPSYTTTTNYHSRSSSEGELSNNSNTNHTNHSHHSHHSNTSHHSQSTTNSWNLSYLTNPANPATNSK